MLKFIKEHIEIIFSVVTSVLALVGSIRAELPWHATVVLVLCLVLALFVIFYPWRFPKWVKPRNSTTNDDFYPVMKVGWFMSIGLATLVGVLWPVANFVWVKSPDILVERMQKTYFDVQLGVKMTRDGVWDAKLAQQTPIAPPILVALPTLDQNRLPQVSQDRKCVPAIQALRAAFGELSGYSSYIILVMCLAIFLGLPLLVGAERMHEAVLKALARKTAAQARQHLAKP